MKRLVIGEFLLLPAVLLFPAGVASAAPSDYVLVADQPTITSGDDNSYTTTVNVINLTDQMADVSASTSDAGSRCTLTTTPAELPASQQAEFSILFEGCNIEEDEAIGLTLTVATSPFEVTATLDSATDPQWDILWSFLGSIPFALLAVGTGLIWFHKSKKKGDLAAATSGGDDRGPVTGTTELPYLGATWSFKDSWVSNATLVTAAFTGLFGTSDLLESVTGAEAPSALAVITIGSAIGVALVGVAPLVLQASRNKDSVVLVGGLIASAALTVSGAAGLVAVIVRTTSSLITSTWANLSLWAGGVLGLLCLGWYAAASVRQNLVTGLTPPPAPPTQPTVAEIVAALLNQRDLTDVMDEALVAQLDAATYPSPYPYGANSPGDEPYAAII